MSNKTDSNLNVGVIGCGYWGPKLARNIHEIPDATLSMVADLREERLAELKQLYPQVETTTNYWDLLNNDLDAVIVATPVNTHYALAKDALQTGKHVLVEKPITADVDQAQELIQIADDKDLKLMVGHTFEYNAAVETVRQIIQSGELGDIYYLNSTRVNLGLLQPDINVMWDLAPHDLSILRFILEDDPVRVSARGEVYVNKYSKLDEVVYMLVMFASGYLANLRLSWLDPVKQRRLTVVGSKKMLVYDDIADEKVIIYDKGVEVPSYSVTEEEFHASYRHGEGTNVSFDWVEPLRTECSHFLDCIRTGETPRSNGRIGLKILQILETAQRSLMNGGVELNIEQ
ncbi:MAG: Gfo/Idh/MocA family oxidoreductase [Chloroflexota bacterium]|nr:Gfo/Idh/MocA family oxidoreductase [Chloroflexota bacterium]